MANKISEHEICDRIIEARRDAIRNTLTAGVKRLGYSRKQFNEDMRADGFMQSAETIRGRWTTLKVDGVIVETESEFGGTRTELDLDTLYIRAGKQHHVLHALREHAIREGLM